MTSPQVESSYITDGLDWPAPEIFLDLSHVQPIATPHVRCTGIALCDSAGQPARVFYQGQLAHFYYEFEILQPIAIPAGGVELHDTLDRVIHGKNSFQYGTQAPTSVAPGSILRFHQAIKLDIGADDYRCSVGLAMVSADDVARYRNGSITDEAFRRSMQELCRVMQVVSLRVELDPAGRLLHHGLANLPGDCQLSVANAPDQDNSAGTFSAVRRWAAGPIGRLRALGGRPTGAPEPPIAAPNFALRTDVEQLPTVFHITHWKAGSQWLNKILTQCAPDRIVPPQVGDGQFLTWPLQAGKVYPTIYVTYQQFMDVRMPAAWRRFVVIRDLRDTLISAYFSMKISHPEHPQNALLRESLQALSFEAGLNLLMDEWLPACARIQLSWHEAGEPLT